MTEGMSPVSSPIKAWSPERPPAFSGSVFNSARALAPLPQPLANPGWTTVHASSSGKHQQQCGAWKSPEPHIASHPQPAHAQQAHRAAAANPLGPPRSPAALAAAAQGVAALQPQRPPPPPPPGLASPAARRPAGAEGGALGPFSRGGSQADLISFAEAHRDEFSVELLPGGASRLLRSPSGEGGSGGWGRAGRGAACACMASLLCARACVCACACACVSVPGQLQTSMVVAPPRPAGKPGVVEVVLEL